MNDGAAVNPDGSIETERDTINRLVKNRDELVQHLQSQKEEISDLKLQCDSHQNHFLATNDEADKLFKQVESQKEEAEKWNYLRPEVQWFAEQMELALRENDYKSGWKDEHQSWLLGELYRNAGKIFDSHYSLRRLVNTANFAMMIADNARSILQEGDK